MLSVPYALRFKMAYSPDATSVVLGAFISAVNSDLRRRARQRKLHGRLQTGSLSVVQRFGSSLNLNVHFHVIVMDGVYAQQPDGNLLFHPGIHDGCPDVTEVPGPYEDLGRGHEARSNTQDPGPS